MSTEERLEAEYKKGFREGWKACEQEKHHVQPEGDGQNARLIINLVEQAYDVSIDKMNSKTRKGEIATARQISMYLLIKYTTLSLKNIGKIFNRDHTTVMHARDKIKKLKSIGDALSLEIILLEKLAHSRFIKKEPIPVDVKMKIKELPRKNDRRRQVISRPPAEYSNSGYINLTKRLASCDNGQ